MNLYTTIFSDAAQPWQLRFQDPATPIAQRIIDLHHDVFSFVIFILTFVVWILRRTIYLFSNQNNPTPVKIIHGTIIETAWTVIPSFILIIIAIPSFALLFSIDEIVDPAVTLKSIRHQWYWSYEYSDYNSEDSSSINFDSYMIPEDDLDSRQLRLLEVDNRVVLPVQTHIRVIISAADVLHSWAIPSLGVKCDAVPRRLNQASFYLQRERVFYRQCSELCGTNHRFIPIVIEVVSLDTYTNWIASRLQDAALS